MKRAREILNKTIGRKAVVFRKKGSTELLGFTTDKNIPFYEIGTYTDGYYWAYNRENLAVLDDNGASYFRIIRPGNFIFSTGLNAIFISPTRCKVDMSELA
jgi:hypothetical protein